LQSDKERRTTGRWLQANEGEPRSNNNFDGLLENRPSAGNNAPLDEGSLSMIILQRKNSFR